MNTNQLKRFAQEARTKLLQQVGAKMNYVLSQDTSELRGKADTLQKLNEEIHRHGKQAMIDKVSYTWFNRLVALRFMDVNGYQPIGLSVVSPATPDHVSPQILTEAHSGNIPGELKVNKTQLFDILDGRQPSNNPDNEVYRMLLVAACNHLSHLFPFLFERIEDYTELLLPDDLTSPFSIVTDIVNGMAEEDCREVEIIGWLYQFYISEKNEELIQSKKTYKKDELAPASQLFTPKWIVRYMVDNTLGQFWSECYPQTRILTELEFYIKPDYVDKIKKREVNIEEVKFFDPCAGSGHILSYAFDVFYRIYEELGYEPNRIPELIITKNLWGVDIDQRASQLASFVLLMKGRERYRRFFRKIESSSIVPNIYFYQDFETDSKFDNAEALGSLIQVNPKEYESIQVDENSLFSEKQSELKALYRLLGQRYDLVVTNPPYINSSRMEASVKKYVEKNYPDTKSDLFATFVIRCLELCKDDGLTGYMTPFVWMFISSYEKLRKRIIDKHFINNLVQLEYSGFDGATVPICTFTLRNNAFKDARGSYIRLSDFKGSENQAPKALEAIQNPQCGWFYTANQKDFKKIPGSPIGYWLSEKLLKVFENKLLENYANPRQGLATGNNEKYLRLWQEVSYNKSHFQIKDNNQIRYSNIKWVPCTKGGPFRRWYGNNYHVIAFDESSYSELINSGNHLPSRNYYFMEGASWSTISSSKISFRLTQNQVFETKGSVCLPNNNYDINIILGSLNSKITQILLYVTSPTLDYHEGPLRRLPFIYYNNINIINITKSNITLSRTDWDSRETSWDFQQNELIRCKSNCGQNCADIDLLSEEDRNEISEIEKIPTNSNLLKDCYEAYKSKWTKMFFQLHQNEEELNRQFIEIYGLQDELTPDVPLEEITILQEETSIKNGELVFHADEVFAQFVSYAVGCMFGRYSLDKPGLILANQGETLQDYLEKVGKGEEELTFVPDRDNIIPVLDDEWFRDDIVERFHTFLKASFGEQNFRKNLDFVEECLGKDIRKYFTRDFYKDHIRRYKKRPIYWMFSSPKGYFNVLVYLHRYTPDTINRILNSYLKEFIEKLKMYRTQQEHIEVEGSVTEQNKARKEIDRINVMLEDCMQYETEILYPLATERIALDLDDGVLVNYNKLGSALALVDGLNDKKTKEKVRKFDWIDTSQIRD
jgi:type II restriction/modification system DNA methylase subunit YeeA